jgi:UDP-glucose 4-epimerase
MRVLVTGGSGFLGSLLLDRLAQLGWQCLSVDLNDPRKRIPGVVYYKADLMNQNWYHLVPEQKIDAVFHLATALDFSSSRSQDLLANNISSTINAIEFSKRHGVKKFVFTSSNSVFLGSKSKFPISEVDTPSPVDTYGRSKVACEQIVLGSDHGFETVVIRCPNIMDAGRIGVLSVLFDFINEGRKCWILGSGSIRHQCIYAQDLIDALISSVSIRGSHLFHIGSDGVSTIRQMYEHLISESKTGSALAQLPVYPTLWLLKLLHRLRLIPLGPYQFRMLTQDFQFDTTKIKRELSWQPTLSNQAMLWKAYKHYIEEINTSQLLGNSPNSAAVSMKLVKIVKFFS